MLAYKHYSAELHAVGEIALSDHEPRIRQRPVTLGISVERGAGCLQRELRRCRGGIASSSSGSSSRFACEIIQINGDAVVAFGGQLGLRCAHAQRERSPADQM